MTQTLLNTYQEHTKNMRERIYTHMLSTRGWKYRSFLRYLRLFKYAAIAPKRGAFLESYYTMMRYIDDVVDGDAPLPKMYSDTVDFISHKIEFSEKLSDPKDEVDYMMLFCFELAQSFNADFHSETKDILESLLFDAQRRRQLILFPEDELRYHFHVLDIRGTIRATLKIFNDDPEKYLFLEPLGMACRHQYNIEDIETDLAAGYVNIPQEECRLLGIEMKDLEDASSAKIRSWLILHAHQGIQLLEKHREIYKEGNFTFLERLTFRLVYENPARRLFGNILSQAKQSDKERIWSIQQEKSMHQSMTST